MTAAERRCDTALHEAGHAIVGRAMGIEVSKAVLHSNEAGACHVELDPLKTLGAIERELAFMLAGRVAQALAKQEDWRRLSLLNSLERETRGSRRYVEVAAALLGDDGRAAERWLEKALTRAAGEAEHILVRQWDEVQELAAELLVDGQVQLETVSELDQRAARARARMRRLAAKRRSGKKRSSPSLPLSPRARVIRDAVYRGKVSVKHSSRREVRERWQA